jgi:hypothetical protein
MLCRKDYTQEELDAARTASDRQLSAYRALVATIGGATPDPKVRSALSAFEPLFFDNLPLALDRRLVHRLRVVAGRDGNPLNEVEPIAASLMNNDGVLGAGNVIELELEESVLELGVGDRIGLSAAEFERLSDAFLAEIEARFV